HIKLNLEMAATDEMIDIAVKMKPEMAMLVPEGREEITTEGGLEVARQTKRLKEVVARLAAAGIVTSVFIDADVRQVEAAAVIGAKVCEIHTGPYAHAFHAKGRDAESAAVVAELDTIRRAGDAARARDAGRRSDGAHSSGSCSACASAGRRGDSVCSELCLACTIVGADERHSRAAIPGAGDRRRPRGWTRAAIPRRLYERPADAL